MVEPAAGGDTVAQRPRFTGRAAVLVLVLALLMASYASSLRAYFDQRHHIASLNESIVDSKTQIAVLEREKKRWDDPAYVMSQARARFAFGLPGEVGYQVLDENGDPLDHVDSLSTPKPVAVEKPEWWESTLESIGVAADPPKETEDQGPAKKITPPPDLQTPTEP